MLRRATSVVSGVLVLLSAEFWMAPLFSWSERLGVETAGAFGTLIIVSCFAVAGCVAGVIARRRDTIPLIGVEVFGLTSVLLSLAMAAVETGTKEIGRNVAIGLAGLLAMAIVYGALQLLKPVQSPIERDMSSTPDRLEEPYSSKTTRGTRVE